MSDKSTEQYILWLDQVERERDELRAKLKRWEAIDLGKIDAINELRAEIERLKAEILGERQGTNRVVEHNARTIHDLRAENERLRAFVGRVVGAYAVDEWIAEEGRQLLNDESWSP